MFILEYRLGLTEDAIFNLDYHIANKRYKQLKDYDKAEKDAYDNQMKAQRN